jgi:hypothetical protein
LRLTPGAAVIDVRLSKSARVSDRLAGFAAAAPGAGAACAAAGDIPKISTAPAIAATHRRVADGTDNGLTHRPLERGRARMPPRPVKTHRWVMLMGIGGDN